MSFLTDEKKEILDKFVLFVKEQLELKTVPTVKIQNNRDGLKTTANYDYTKENKIIKVCAKNRALVDVCRSIAHEMVHHKQFEDGRLEKDPLILVVKLRMRLMLRLVSTSKCTLRKILISTKNS